MLVALTGYGQEEDRRKALDAGFDRHIVKPANLDDLVQLLVTLPDVEKNGDPASPSGGE